MLLTAACDITLASGLSAGDAAHMSAELNRHAVAATQVRDDGTRGRYRLEVSANAVEAALTALSSERCQRTDTDATAASDEEPLLPSEQDRRQRLDRALGLELTRSIELLPGVQRARVQLTRPSPNPSLADLTHASAPPTPSASVVLMRARNSQPVTESARALLLAAIPQLAPQSIAVIENTVEEAPGECTPLSRVGPIGVTRDSTSMLKAWLAAALLVHMLLAAALLYVLTRQRGHQPPTS
jgi:type III secretory pathway lipoprotein EscJ